MPFKIVYLYSNIVTKASAPFGIWFVGIVYTMFYSCSIKAIRVKSPEQIRGAY